MKCILIYTIFTLALLCGTACQQNRKQMDGNNNTDQPQTFTTAEGAANKAKADLLAVIRSGNVNLGLDSAALSRSQPATPVKQYQITFDKLLSADSTNGFGNMKQDEKATIVPLVDRNNIITVTEVSRDDKGWRVASLGSKEISSDLNIVRSGIGDAAGGEITIYNLPHTATKVYGVKRGDTELFYTNYPGFTIRQGVPANSLLPLLRREAQEYQRKYGDGLKNKKLVR